MRTEQFELITERCDVGTERFLSGMERFKWCSVLQGLYLYEQVDLVECCDQLLLFISYSLSWIWLTEEQIIELLSETTITTHVE